jgi:zinc protease
MLSSLLDEGAGTFDSQAFQRRMQDLNMKMSFNASLDHFSGTFQTLTEKRDDAFEMLRLALNEPRFDTAPVERIRGQILVSIARKGQDPDDVAANAWMRLAFADHAYSKPTEGMLETVRAITPEDLKDMARRLFARGGLKIAVVGDIDAATLGGLLDKVFGGLPGETQLATVSETAVTAGPAQEIIDMNIPQSVIQFGHAGFKRKDDDFIPAYILNYILGGGGFNSRLTVEVREKRGLAYSVYSYLSTLDRAGLFLGGAATRNDRVGQSLDIIRAELSRMATEGPTAEELANAKTYLTGSYALRFDSSTNIAGQLLGIQLEDLGKDYVDKRNGLVEAVTIEDIKRVARRLLQPGQLIVTIVGRPEGLVKLKTGG